MHKYWKILLPLLFALAIFFGLLQRQDNPYVGFRKYAFHFGQNSPDKSLEDYFLESQKLAKQNQPAMVSFLAVGDIMLSRNVANAIKKTNDPLLPFSKMTDVLKSANFSFGNLESPIDPSLFLSPGMGRVPPPKAEGERLQINNVPSGSMVFKTAPDAMKGLIDYKFKIVNLASNHALDQGLKGLEFTKKFLSDNNIKSVGVGKNQDEAWQPEVMEANGVKVAFIGASYASINDNGKTQNNYVARIEDTKKLEIQISNVKKLADFVVVSMHAGTEYTRTPNQKQINFAHAAIDAGADLVIGHHPHWIQTIERYAPNCPSPRNGEGAPSASDRFDSTQDRPELSRTGEGQERLKCGTPKYIFYSLGNFIFDQMWSEETREGLALKIQLSKNQILTNSIRGAVTLDDLQGTRLPARLENIELLPVIIENYSTPRLANDEEARKILEKINQKEKILY